MSALEERADEELEKARRLIEVDVSQAMTASAPEPQFVIKPLVPRGAVTLLGAHGGSGKSTLALTWCAHVAAGWGWSGLIVESGAAVYVSLEDPSPVVLYRLQKIVTGYGLRWPDIAKRVRVLDGTDIDAALMTELNNQGNRVLVPTAVMAEVEEAAEGAGLVVIDNASDGFDGDENSRRHVRHFIRRLSQVAKANNAGLVLLAHIDKHAARSGGRGNNYSGSTQWHNGPRSRLALIQPEDSELVELRQEKLNLGKKMVEPVTLAWSESGVLIPCKVDPDEREEAARQQMDDDAKAILRVLQLADEEGLIIPTARTGQRTTWHALCELPELPEHLRDKTGKARVQAGLTALERTKKIIREVTRNPATRKTVERWTLARSARAKAA